MNGKMMFLKQSVKLNGQYLILSFFSLFLFYGVTSSFLSQSMVFLLNFLVIAFLFLTTVTRMLVPKEGSYSFYSYSLRYFETLPFRKEEVLLLTSVNNIILFSPLILLSTLITSRGLNFDFYQTLFMLVQSCMLVMTATCLQFVVSLLCTQKLWNRLNSTQYFIYLIRCVGLGALLVAVTYSVYSMAIVLKLSFLRDWFMQIFGVLQKPVKLLSVDVLILTSLLSALSFVVAQWMWNRKKTTLMMFRSNLRGLAENVALYTLVVILIAGSAGTRPNFYKGNDLNLAIFRGDSGAVEKLSELPAFYDKVNDFGVSPLKAALLRNDCHSFQVLKTKGFKVYQSNRIKGESADDLNLLGHVAISGCSEALDKMIGQEFKINDPVHSKGWAALHLTAQYCQPEIAEKLLRWGADPDVEDSNGNTPLFYSTQRECHAVNMLLKTYEANISAKNKKGETPKDWLPAKASPSSLYFYSKQANL